MPHCKELLHRLLSWCPLYRIAVGGYRYYNLSQERTYDPSQFHHFGEGAFICADVKIIPPEKMFVGDGAFVGPECMIYAMGGFHLGNYSGLGSRTTVLTVEHQHAGAETIPFGQNRIVKPVYIGDFVWVGVNVSVLPGVRIGEGAIVGLGSVVAKDVPPMAITMGNPAQVIGHRNREAFERLKAAGAVRRIPTRSSSLWVPPLTRRKYTAEELACFGFDVADGREFFEVRRTPRG